VVSGKERYQTLNLKNFVNSGDKEYCISTVQLPFAHIGGLYETMIFPATGGEISDWGELFMERYETQGEAERGHDVVVAQLQAGELELYK
jgi:hypothetical protein